MTCMYVNIVIIFNFIIGIITVHMATKTRKTPDTAIFQNGRQNLTDFATPKDV